MDGFHGQPSHVHKAVLSKLDAPTADFFLPFKWNWDLNGGGVKMSDLKMTDVKLTDRFAGHEIAGHENDWHETVGYENTEHQLAGHKSARYETISEAANVWECCCCPQPVNCVYTFIHLPQPPLPLATRWVLEICGNASLPRKSRELKTSNFNARLVTWYPDGDARLNWQHVLNTFALTMHEVTLNFTCDIRVIVIVFIHFCL